jgi:hypothetical protein
MRLLNARGEIAVLLLAAAVAALAPFATRSSGAVASAPFPGWPTHYDGRALTELPLTPREAGFTQDFPGRVGRFSDGQREIIIRWVGAPTRRLHPAADCFRGALQRRADASAERCGGRGDDVAPVMAAMRLSAADPRPAERGWPMSPPGTGPYSHERCAVVVLVVAERRGRLPTRHHSRLG